MNFKKAFAILCQHFKFEANEVQAKTYSMCLSELEVDWSQAVKIIIKNCDRFPSVKKINDLLLPNIEENIPARLRAGQLLSELENIIAKHGWSNENLAMEEMSPRLALLVRHLGGWQRVCVTNFENASKYAQARDMAEMILQKKIFDDKKELVKSIIANKSIELPNDDDIEQKKLEAIKKLR